MLAELPFTGDQVVSLGHDQAARAGGQVEPRAARPGADLRQRAPELVHPGKGHHEIAVTRDIECRNAHPRSAKACQKLRVAIDVAVQLRPPRNPVRVNSPT
jgi:hypothetical protein